MYKIIRKKYQLKCRLLMFICCAKVCDWVPLKWQYRNRLSKLNHRTIQSVQNGIQCSMTLVYSVPKKCHTCFFLYLQEILTDFQNSFTSTLTGQLAINWLLNISPHHNCVATLPCKIDVRKTSNRQQSHWWMNKTLQTKIAVNNYVRCCTVLEPALWVSGVLKNTFVSGLSGLLGLAVHPQWSRSLQLCTRFNLQPHAFGRCFTFQKFFQYPLQAILFELV